MLKTDPVYLHLERRLGRAHLTQRLETERYHATRAFGYGRTYFHIENMLWVHSPLKWCLRVMGLYRRGQRNARSPVVRHHTLFIEGLPAAFEGFTMLHLSDLHLDMNPAITDAVAAAVQRLDYDVCVITGDFRCRTYGLCDAMLRELARLRPFLHGDIYGVLGNHDWIATVPPMEAMGVRILLNEAVPLRRQDQVLYLAGIDDAHYYETDNIQKSAQHLDHDARAILLSHTPEAYKKAAACGFSAMLCGHTHAGQICAPGGIPFMINASIPLRLGRGAWRYRGMQGYTSAGTGCSGVDVRFWCPPELVLHKLSAVRGDGQAQPPA
jgi:predicted MPP superfamily phosphohydrolase